MLVYFVHATYIHTHKPNIHTPIHTGLLECVVQGQTQQHIDATSVIKRWSTKDSTRQEMASSSQVCTCVCVYVCMWSTKDSMRQEMASSSLVCTCVCMYACMWPWKKLRDKCWHFHVRYVHVYACMYAVCMYVCGSWKELSDTHTYRPTAVCRYTALGYTLEYSCMYVCNIGMFTTGCVCMRVYLFVGLCVHACVFI
jgi:hypothetical protein